MPRINKIKPTDQKQQGRLLNEDTEQDLIAMIRYVNVLILDILNRINKISLELIRVPKCNIILIRFSTE